VELSYPGSLDHSNFRGHDTRRDRRRVNVTGRQNFVGAI
jgi:hypothetical protein